MKQIIFWAFPNLRRIYNETVEDFCLLFYDVMTQQEIIERRKILNMTREAEKLKKKFIKKQKMHQDLRNKRNKNKASA